MRILYCHEDERLPGAGGGGAETILHTHLQVLKARGHEVFWWHGQQALDRTVAQWRPDVAVLFTVHNQFGSQPARTLEWAGVPRVWFLMDYWPFCGPRMLLRDGDMRCAACDGICDMGCGQRPVNLQYAEVVNSVECVVALSQGQGRILERNGVRVDCVCSPGIDTRLFRPANEAPTSAPVTPAGVPGGRGSTDRVRIVTSSAWPEYPTKGMHVLRQALKEEGLSGRLLRGMAREALADTLREADVFVFPSCYEETFGLCLTEAMSSGLACIASGVAGPRDQIRDGETGLLVPPRDPEALGRAIRRLVDDADLRTRLGAAARAQVLREYTLSHLGDRLERLLGEVTGREA